MNTFRDYAAVFVVGIGLAAALVSWWTEPPIERDPVVMKGEL